MIMVAFLAIVSRLLYLHVFQQEKLLKIVEGNRQKFEVLSARRGNIIDTRGNLLASTETRIDLGVDPQVLREEDKRKWPLLASLIKKDLKFIENKFTKITRGSGGKENARLIRWTKLVDSLDEDTYEKVRALKIKGVYGNRKYQRAYPHGALAAHVLGFVNKEGTASAGVERYMEFYLRGQDGWLETECDGRRLELAQFRSREVEPVDGTNVELSIDLTVQHAIEKELERIVEVYNPKGPTVIVSEPSTGYILGLANYPSFDPNSFWESDIDFHRNRAVSDVFEPGSPFKTVTASAAINEDAVSLDDMYDCSVSSVEYRGRNVRLPKDHRPMDKLSFKDVIKKSSNRGVAQIAMLLGDEKIHEYAKSFGFGEKTGYGPDAEVSGYLPAIKNWDGLTISRLPMGHALNCTPLQLHYAMSVIANEGVLMQPQVVKRVFDERNNTITAYTPYAKRRVITAKTAKIMSDLLSEVVGPEGTSKRAEISGFQVAGKSGTTQKIVNGRYSRQCHVASFSGFFPAQNPRVIITVVIDEAQLQGVAYGGLVAAPAFQHIGEQLIQYLNIQPYNFTKQMLAWRGN